MPNDKQYTEEMAIRLGQINDLLDAAKELTTDPAVMHQLRLARGHSVKCVVLCARIAAPGDIKVDLRSNDIDYLDDFEQAQRS